LTTVDRSRFARLACVAATLIWAAIPGPAAAQEGPPPPSSIGVCPAIEEDGLLCSADLLSGNCADFVAAADRLGALYRSELAKLPDSEASLLTTMWWGCGPGNLGDIAALLVRIGSPPALVVLQTQPYASIGVTQSPPPAPAPGSLAPPPACDELSSALQRNACIGAQLQAARAENQSVFARCQSFVPPGLRDDFVDSQSSFQSLLPVRCDAQAAGVDEKSMKTFVRSRCLVQALTDNTRAMLTAHPECRAVN
jgi:hypothetical protein